MIRDVKELLAATFNWYAAKVRGLANPCPPHDFTHGWAFCEKCGKFKDEIE